MASENQGNDGSAVQDRAEPTVWVTQGDGGWSSDRTSSRRAAGAGAAFTNPQTEGEKND